MKPREFTKTEIEERRVKRKTGELKDDPVPELLPADSNRMRQRIYVTLHPDAVGIARKLGNGVVSRGIDRALFNYKPPKGRPKNEQRRQRQAG